MSHPFLIKRLPDDMLNDDMSCPLCDGLEVITDNYTGEEVCSSCGCVLNDNVLDRSREHRTHGVENRESGQRHGVGTRQSIYDKGLSTIIDGKRDINGTHLSRETITNMSRLQRHDNRSKINESVTRNLSIAMTELDRLISALNLSVGVKENSAYIYRKALTMNLIRGRSIDAFVAASIYAACRMLSIPRPLKTVADESKRLHSEVSMTYRLLLKELNLKPPVDEPLKYIPNLASKLGINRTTERRAVELLIKAKALKAVTGKDPRGVAAAALYLASQLNGERLVQRRVAKVAETTEVTLRNRYRGLKKALDIV